jgi:hypothetical protein
LLPRVKSIPSKFLLIEQGLRVKKHTPCLREVVGWFVVHSGLISRRKSADPSPQQHSPGRQPAGPVRWAALRRPGSVSVRCSAGRPKCRCIQLRSPRFIAAAAARAAWKESPPSSPFACTLGDWNAELAHQGTDGFVV